MADIDSYKNMERVKIKTPDGVIDGYIVSKDTKKKKLYIRAYGYGLLIANEAPMPQIQKTKGVKKNETEHSKGNLRKPVRRAKSRA